MSELEAETSISSNDVTNFFTSLNVLDDGAESNFTILLQTTLNPAKGLKVKEYPWVWLYVSPLIFFAGVIGNILTMLIMRRRGMRGSTTSVYLIVLSFFDLCALITRIPPEFFKACSLFIFSDINRWTCKIEKFSFYTASDIAIWLLVAFSVDRLVAVTWPFLKKTFCRPRRAMLVCFIIIVVFIAKNLHVFWTRDVEYYGKTLEIKKVCGRPYEHRDFEEYVRPWIAFATISILPFILISISNVVIVVVLTNRHKHSEKSAKKQIFRKTLSQMDQNSIDRISYRRAEVKNSSKRRHRFTQTTLMCIAASICFLILVTPSIALILGRVYWTSRKSSIFGYGIARAINYQLSCLNHAINFFLYCLTGERFRRELINLFRLSKAPRISKEFNLSKRKFSDATSSSANQEHAPPVIKPFIMRDGPSDISH